jgi:nitrate reductase gamma subunit
MKFLYAFFVILALIGLAYLGLAAGFHTFLGIILPYAAFTIFVVGLVYRIVSWARSPVPFKVPTTCGQQKSLSWVKSNNLESPHNFWGLLGRMALEILFFRSLFRNTKMELHDGPKIVYGSEKWLWFFGLVFHWSFFIIIMRHLRFFIEPVPSCITFIESIDGLMEVGVPVFYMTTFGLLFGLTYLVLRRLINPQVKHISLISDYFAPTLIFAIGFTGLLMRHIPVFRVDIVKVKELAMGLISFHPVVPNGIGALFFVHLFLVSILLIYFPVSKLVHMPGVFMSPTRNLINNSRMVRHINPWDYPVKKHTYQEWEDEFRTVMKEAGMPLEKEE